MILRKAPPEHLPWLAQRARIDVTPWLRALEIRTEDGRILGMVGFDGWSGNSCCMHVALEPGYEGMRAGVMLVRPAFEFVFVHCDLGVAVGTVKSTNEKALKLNRHLGFREVFRGKDWFEPGVDQVWMEMRREDCRWLTGSRKAA